MKNFFREVEWLDDRTFRFPDGQIVTPVKPGDIVGRRIGFSEAACATNIAGTNQNVRIIDIYSGQLVNTEGEPISPPYLLCELGFYSNIKYYYH